jgi:hypothetical protein
MNSREPVGRIVAYSFVYGTFENGLDSATGAMVHAVSQLEIAE